MVSEQGEGTITNQAITYKKGGVVNEQEFLESLKNEVQDAELPFNEKDWEALRERLDGKKKRTIFPFIAFIPLSWRYVAGGAAAAALVLFGLKNIPEQGNQVEHKTVQTAPKNYIQKNETQNETRNLAENNIMFSTDAAPLNKQRNSSGKKISTLPIQPLQDKIPTPDLVLIDSIIPVVQKEELSTAKDPQPKIALEQKTPEMEQEINNPIDLPIWNDLKLPERKSMFFAGGGINYGAQNMGYAIKLGLEKPISSRFSVHTALAVNSNDRQVTLTELDKIVPSATISNGANYLSYDTLYKQTNRDFSQAFAQALAGIDYKLYAKGKLGLSADAVRLLRSREALDDFNNDLTTEKSSSLWNVGLRIQYTQQITRHFDIGTLYRQDISGKINNTWENNFLQLMLIYKVGKKK